MKNRALAAVLWFAAISFGYEIVWSMMDVPRLIGPGLAAAVATAVLIDAIGHLRRVRSDRMEPARSISAAGRSLV